MKTQHIESELFNSLNPLYVDLLDKLAKMVRYGIKSKQSALDELNNIGDKWFTTNKYDIVEYINISIDKCVAIAKQETDSKNSLSSGERSELLAATKEPFTSLIDLIEQKFTELITLIAVYNYTSELTNQYIDQIYSSITNRLDLSSINSVIKNYNAALNIIANKSGYNGYIYRTMEDDKVRASHAEHDGKFFTWDNPPSTGHPGTEINCRCTAELIK